MSFLEPIAFLFALSLPVVVLFYLLKRKRKTVLVSSTVLWERFLAETRASTPFQKLRKHWLLLLQLLVLTLAVFALARPYFAGAAKVGGRLLIVVLDGTASMQAQDVDPNRFEVARRQVETLIRSMEPSDRMALLLVGARTEVMQSPTSRKSDLRAALTRCHVSDAQGNLTEALRLAKALIEGNAAPGKAEIHLFSDGVVEDLSGLETEALPLRFHPIGLRGKNVGIVRVEFRRLPDDPTQGSLFIKLYNSWTNQLSVRMEVRHQGRVLDTRMVDLPAEQEQDVLEQLRVPRSGAFHIRLIGQDDLALDNEAWVPVNPAGPLRILLVTQNNLFLQNALAALPGIELREAPLVPKEPKADVLVLDQVAPTEWPAIATLAIRVAPTNWVQVLGRVKNPTIVDWNPAHPLLRFVTFEDLWIAEALKVRPTPSTKVILEAQETPLILAGEWRGRRWVWLGFDPLQSTWPLRVSFPIFIANAMQWLDPRRELIEQAVLPTGKSLIVPVKAGVSKATVQLPNGKSVEVSIDPQTGRLVFGQTDRQGLYQVQFGERTLRFAANLLSLQETKLWPRQELALGKFTLVKADTGKRADLEVWRWFALAALALMLVEWWYYHTRTV